MHRPASPSFSERKGEKKPKPAESLELSVNEEEFLLPVTCKDVLEAKRNEPNDGSKFVSWSIYNGTRPLGSKGLIYIVVKSPIRIDRAQISKNKEELMNREYIVLDESLDPTTTTGGLRILLNQFTGPIEHIGSPPVVSSKPQHDSNNRERPNWYSIRDNVPYNNRMYHAPLLDRAAENRIGYFALVGKPVLFERSGYVKLSVFQVRETDEEEYLFHQIYSLASMHRVSFIA